MTAKPNDADPPAGPADVLDRITDTPLNRLDELLPRTWAELPDQSWRAAA